MDNFDYIKYLKEGKLFEESVNESVNDKHIDAIWSIWDKHFAGERNPEFVEQGNTSRGWVLDIYDDKMSSRQDLYREMFYKEAVEYLKDNQVDFEDNGNQLHIFNEESVNESASNRVKNRQGNIVTMEDGRKYRMLTTKPSLKKPDFYIDTTLSQEYWKVYQIDPNDSYMLDLRGRVKVIPISDPVNEPNSQEQYFKDKEREENPEIKSISTDFNPYKTTAGKPSRGGWTGD